MTMPNNHWRFALALLMFAGGLEIRAEDQVQWRSWGVREGLVETYTYQLSVTPDGNAYVRHGAVRTMSVFDGYTVTRIPEPRGRVEPNWASESRVYVCPGCAPWVISEGELRTFRNGRWETHYSPLPSETLIAAVPAGRRVVVIADTGLREYTPGSRAWREIEAARHTAIRPFLRAVPSGDGEIWIAGEHGLGRLFIAKDGGPYEWTEVDTHSRYSHFDFPEPGARGELFAQGISQLSGRRAIVRWAKSTLQEIITSSKTSLRGWRGPDGLIWILEGASMYRLSAGEKQKVDRTGVLSGSIFDVFMEGVRSFWIATSDGVVRYTPPLWRRPAGLDGLETTVHAVAEDDGGRLWFAATQWLLEFDGKGWKRHALPPDLETDPPLTDSVIPLASGRVLIKALRSDHSDVGLIFDRTTGQFSELTHPEGRRITMISRRTAGTAWVATEANGVPGFHLEIYDDKGFRTRAEIGAEWKGPKLRCVMEQGNGDLWLGDVSGGALYHNGALLDVFATSKGYSDSGVFVLATLPSGEIVAGGRDQVLKYDGRSWTLLGSGLDRIRSFATARDGSLWVASASGIHRFRDGSWITHQTEEGLPSAIAYLVYEDKQGRIWAGTTHGLMTYDQEADTDAPRTLLERSANAHDVPPSGELRVVFSGIDKWNQTNPDRLLFSYRVDAVRR
jgi:ligand-binding sensor domain-containing protein